MTFDLHYLDHPIESTYQYLMELRAANDQLPSGIVIQAPYQTAGRGQAGNSWYSSPENNALPSIFLRLNLPLEQIWSISEAVAIAVADTCRSYLDPDHHIVQIKWPNDIMVNNQKIAGILIHNQLCDKRITETIIGIGLNVNEITFPTHLPPATSLRLCCNKEHLVPEVLSSLLDRLGKQLDQLTLLPPTSLHNNYLQQLYHRYEQHYYVATGEKVPFLGIIEGVSPTGELMLRVLSGSQQGSTQYYHSKEVQYLPDPH